MFNRKGFTFIELMIVIVILGCIGGFVYLSLKGNDEPETIQPTTTPIVTVIPTVEETTLPYNPTDVVWEQEFPMNECAATNPTDSVNEGSVILIKTHTLIEEVSLSYSEYVEKLYLKNMTQDPPLITEIYSTDETLVRMISDTVFQNCRYLTFTYTEPDVSNMFVLKTDGTIITDSVFITNQDFFHGTYYTFLRPSSAVARNIESVTLTGMVSNTATVQVDLSTGKVVPDSLQVNQ